jgi:MFS family permease
LCDDAIYVDLASSTTYLGAFVGYILISFFSDNFGRRTSILLAWSATTLGAIIVSLSQNIYMAGFGLFLSGAGSDAAINICFYFFGEVVGDKKRQQYSVIVQILFTLGAMTVTLFYYLIPNWRIVSIISITIPSIIGLLLLVLYVE